MPKYCQKILIYNFKHKKRMLKAFINTHLYIKMLPWVLPFDSYRKMSHIQDTPFCSKINVFTYLIIK